MNGIINDDDALCSIHPEPVYCDTDSFHCASYLGEAIDMFMQFAADSLDSATPCMGVLEEFGTSQACNLGMLEPSEGDVYLKVDCLLTEINNQTFAPSVARTTNISNFNAPMITLMHDMLDNVPDNSRIIFVDSKESDIARYHYAMTKNFNAKTFRVAFHRYKVGQTISQRYNSLGYPIIVATELTDIPFEPGGTYLFFPNNFTRVITTATLDGLRYLLRSGNILGMYGTYFDVTALKKNEYSDLFSSQSSLRVIHDGAGVDFSGSLVSDGILSWVDYNLTAAQCTVLGSEGHISMWPARYYTKHVRKPPTELVLYSKSINMIVVRVIKWSRDSVAKLIMVDDHTSTTPFMLHDESPFAYPIHEINRGRPFMSQDLYYLDPANTYYNYKVDGVECVLFTKPAYGRQVLMQFRGDSRLYSYGRLSDYPIFYQCEYVGNTASDKLFLDYTLYLTDVYRTHDASDGGFLDRYNKSVAYANRMGFKEVKGFTHYKLDELVTHQLDSPYKSDGLVINHAFSPPGAFKDLLGASRYLKSPGCYTIDVFDVNGHIVERRLNADGTLGDFVRSRPDKTVPNSVAQIDNIYNAWTIDSFIAYLIHANEDCDIHLSRLGPHRRYEWNQREYFYLLTTWRPRTLEYYIYAKYGFDEVIRFHDSYRVPATGIHLVADESHIDAVEHPLYGDHPGFDATGGSYLAEDFPA